MRIGNETVLYLYHFPRRKKYAVYNVRRLCAGTQILQHSTNQIGNLFSRGGKIKSLKQLISLGLLAEEIKSSNRCYAFKVNGKSKGAIYLSLWGTVTGDVVGYLSGWCGIISRLIYWLPSSLGDGGTCV